VIAAPILIVGILLVLTALFAARIPGAQEVAGPPLDRRLDVLVVLAAGSGDRSAASPTRR